MHRRKDLFGEDGVFILLRLPHLWRSRDSPHILGVFPRGCINVQRMHATPSLTVVLIAMLTVEYHVAEEFRPERWEEDLPLHSDEKNAAWGFLPFNGGPRVCLGRKCLAFPGDPIEIMS